MHKYTKTYNRDVEPLKKKLAYLIEAHTKYKITHIYERPYHGTLTADRSPIKRGRFGYMVVGEAEAITPSYERYTMKVNEKQGLLPKPIRKVKIEGYSLANISTLKIKVTGDPYKYLVFDKKKKIKGFIDTRDIDVVNLAKHYDNSD